ncbi:hypothetical protein L1049_023678 [Liquidambar formosana]|uniref:Transposase n=1 Tax=Liquidambar formosana TaxID=63359 RepID=A0AAP0RUV1_LIQFO
MSDQPESSKKGKKRAKNNNLGAAAATIQQGNENICISDEGSNSPRPSHTNVEASQQSFAPIDDAEKQRKKRGKNKLHLIPLSGCGRLEVEFNERGQPVGENSAKYASHLGSLAREHVPIIIRDWRLVDPQTRDDLWTLVQQKFFVDECHKALTLRMMGCYWRQFKSEVTSQILTAAKRNGFKRRLSLIKPANIKSDREWDAFVRYRLSPQFQDQSSKFRTMRKRQTLLHTMSRKGYARLQHEMRKKNPMVSRADVWTKGHLKKNDEPHNDAIADTLKKMEEYTKSATAESGNDSIRGDAVAHVLGPERGGRVRGLGFGSTLTRVDAQLQSNVKVKQLELQLQKQDEEMKKQGDQMKNILLQFEEMKAMLLGQSKQCLNRGSTTYDDMIQSLANTPQSQQDSGINAATNRENGRGSGQQGSGTHSGIHGAANHENVRNSGHQDSGTHGAASLENARCKILNWCSFDIEEIVAYGKIASTDPYVKVHHVPLGLDCWKVWVD